MMLLLTYSSVSIKTVNKSIHRPRSIRGRIRFRRVQINFNQSSDSVA